MYIKLKVIFVSIKCKILRWFTETNDHIWHNKWSASNYYIQDQDKNNPRSMRKVLIRNCHSKYLILKQVFHNIPSTSLRQTHYT